MSQVAQRIVRYETPKKDIPNEELPYNLCGGINSGLVYKHDLQETFKEWAGNPFVIDYFSSTVSGSEEATPLLKCCASGDEKNLRELIAAGANMNAVTSVKGNTALHQVIESSSDASSDASLVQLLIDEGVRYDVPNKEGILPLQMAKDKNSYNPAIVAALETAGAVLPPELTATYALIDQLKTSSGYRFPVSSSKELEVLPDGLAERIYFAASENKVHELLALSQEWAGNHAALNFHKYSERQFTPLTISAVRGYETCVRILIAAGASVSEKTDCGSTALHWCADCGGFTATAEMYLNIGKVLIAEGADINAENSNRLTPLKWINSYTSEKRAPLQAFLQQEFDKYLVPYREFIDHVKAQGVGYRLPRNSSNPLHSDDGGAINFEDIALKLYRAVDDEKLTFIVDTCKQYTGIDEIFNWRNQYESNFNSLMRVCSSGNADFALLLIAAGADINAEDGSGRSTLELHASAGNSDICRMLIAEGAKVATTTSENRKSPLRSAKSELNNLLQEKERGAAIDEARKTRFEVCVAVLTEADPEGSIALAVEEAEAAAVATAEKKFVEDTLNLLKTSSSNYRFETPNADVEAPYGTDREIYDKCLTPIKDFLPLCVKWAGNSVIDHYKEWGRTALVEAAGLGNSDIVRVLIAAGANVCVRDEYNNPTAYLNRAVTSGYTECVKLIVDAGYDVAVTDDSGYDALMYANLYQQSNQEMIDILKTAAAKLEAEKAKATEQACAIIPGFRFPTPNKDISASGQDAIVAKIVAAIKTNRILEFLDLCTTWAGNVAILDGDSISDRSSQKPLLIVACQEGRFDYAKVLVAASADVNAKCDEGEERQTALHITACMNVTGAAEFCQFLIDEGADALALNSTGLTPLDLANKNFYAHDLISTTIPVLQAHLQVVASLVSATADLPDAGGFRFPAPGKDEVVDSSDIPLNETIEGVCTGDLATRDNAVADKVVVKAAATDKAATDKAESNKEAAAGDKAESKKEAAAANKAATTAATTAATNKAATDKVAPSAPRDLPSSSACCLVQ